MRTKKKKFGVGIIGLGMGQAHLEAYKNNPYTEVIGICDTYISVYTLFGMGG